jgi:hypothetical protein
MSITGTCPFCAEDWRVSDDRAGERTRCPSCGKRVTIPGGDEPEDEEEAPARNKTTSVRKKRRRARDGCRSRGLSWVGPVLMGLLLIALGIGFRVAAAKYDRLNPGFGIGLIVLGVLAPMQMLGMFGGGE